MSAAENEDLVSVAADYWAKQLTGHVPDYKITLFKNALTVEINQMIVSPYRRAPINITSEDLYAPENILGKALAAASIQAHSIFADKNVVQINADEGSVSQFIIGSGNKAALYRRAPNASVNTIIEPQYDSKGVDGESASKMR